MPIISEFDAAMMQAALSVPAVRRLGGGAIRMNDSGRPLRAAGRDAVVYELRAPDGPFWRCEVTCARIPTVTPRWRSDTPHLAVIRD